MVYSEKLAERISAYLESRAVAAEEKKMFGGMAFMVDGKMCVGVTNDDLMVRIDPAIYDEALKKEGCRQMNFTGRSMKGFVFVEQSALARNESLGYWVDLALEFNPRAKSSKKES